MEKNIDKSRLADEKVFRDGEQMKIYAQQYNIYIPKMLKYAFCSIACLVIATRTHSKHHHHARSHSPYLYEQAICARFQQEARFLREWLEYHLLIGITHFYLFNNGSTDQYKQVLQSYINRGIVELFDEKPSYNAPAETYNKILTQTTSQAKWLACIDVDEFLVPLHNTTLATVLAQFDQYAILFMNGIIFGTSQIERVHGNQCMIEQLTRCSTKIHSHMYSIIRPNQIEKCIAPKIWVSKAPFKSINISPDIMRINHYWTRDLFYFNLTKIPQIAYATDTHSSTLHDSTERTNNRIARAHQIAISLNETTDTAILSFVPRLKKNIE